MPLREGGAVERQGLAGDDRVGKPAFDQSAAGPAQRSAEGRITGEVGEGPG